MRGGRGADLAKQVGTGAHQGAVQLSEEFDRQGMIRDPHSHAGQSRRDQLGDFFPLGQNEGEWPGPESPRQLLGDRRDRLHHPLEPVRPGEVHDEWIKMGSPLDGEDPGNRRRLEQIRPQPVHGLGGKRTDAPGSQQFGGPRHLGGRQPFGDPATGPRHGLTALPVREPSEQVPSRGHAGHRASRHAQG